MSTMPCRTPASSSRRRTSMTRSTGASFSFMERPPQEHDLLLEIRDETAVLRFLARRLLVARHCFGGELPFVIEADFIRLAVGQVVEHPALDLLRDETPFRQP